MFEILVDVQFVGFRCFHDAMQHGTGLSSVNSIDHLPVFLSNTKRPDCLFRLACDSTSTRIIKCIENGLSVASFHTCLDIAEGGVNDTLCEKLGIENTTAFLPFGRIGDVREQSFSDFCVFASEALKCIPFQTVDAGRSVRRVAVVSGGGKDEVRDAYDAGADTYLTGEASHSAMIDAAEYGINMLCCGHFETENPVVPVLAGIISKHFPDIEVITLGS